MPRFRASRFSAGHQATQSTSGAIRDTRNNYTTNRTGIWRHDLSLTTSAVPIALGDYATQVLCRFGGLRTGMSQFASSLPFGAGYSLGTYLGFPGNYQNRSRSARRQIPVRFVV